MSYVIVFLSVCVTLGAYLLHKTSITKVKFIKMSIFSKFTFIYIIVLAFQSLYESLTSSQMMACGLILSGLVLGQSCRRKAPLNVSQAAVE